MKKDLIVFLDSGDTLVDESTQIFAQNGDVISAELFEGAREVLKWLVDNHYRVALVADGRVQSFENVYTGLGLNGVFEQWIISEAVGEEKPHLKMFETAMEKMNLAKEDASRIVMVGNNLKRDVLGANRMGLISILQAQSPRYDMTVENAEETPDYQIESIQALPGLIEKLDKAIKDESKYEKAAFL